MRSLLLAPLALLSLPGLALAQRPLVMTPSLPSAEDSVVLLVNGFGCAPGEEEELDVDGDQIDVRLGAYNPCFRPFYWTRRVVLGRFDPGLYRVEVSVGGEPFGRDAFVVRETSTLLALYGQRFQIRVDWIDSAGDMGSGFAVPLGEASGYFWFFDSANVEVLLKVLDGRSINGHFWVFLSSLTDVELTVSVVDIGDGLCLELPVNPPGCPTWTYLQPAGENRNVLDVRAFPADG